MSRSSVRFRQAAHKASDQRKRATVAVSRLSAWRVGGPLLAQPAYPDWGAADHADAADNYERSAPKRCADQHRCMTTTSGRGEVIRCSSGHPDARPARATCSARSGSMPSHGGDQTAERLSLPAWVSDGARGPLNAIGGRCGPRALLGSDIPAFRPLASCPQREMIEPYQGFPLRPWRNDDAPPGSVRGA
jgi:hypothetical protein